MNDTPNTGTEQKPASQPTTSPATAPQQNQGGDNKPNTDKPAQQQSN